MVRSRLTTLFGAQNESSIVTLVNGIGAYCRHTVLSAVSGVGVSVTVLKICFPPHGSCERGYAQIWIFTAVLFFFLFAGVAFRPAGRNATPANS